MRYDGIQCLRAAAALLVVWAHLKYSGEFLAGSPFIATAAGAVGVDVFFVISGFVISLSAVRLNFSWQAFLRNRLCRIVPFYWLMSLPLAIDQIRKGSLHWHAAANTVLFIPLFDFGTFKTPIHDFGWTLSFEFWFYLLFAALLATAGSRALVIISPLLAMLCGLMHFGYTGAWFTPKFLFNPFTLEFAAGVLLYRCRRFAGIWTLGVSLLLAVILGWATLRTEALGYHLTVLANPLLGFKRVLIWGGFGVALVTVAISIDNLKLLTWPSWLVWLGDCSYSIYLMQPFALMAAARANHTRFAAVPWVAAAVYVTTAVLGGAIVSKCVEMPLTRWFKKRFASRPLPNVATPQAV